VQTEPRADAESRTALPNQAVGSKPGPQQARPAQRPPSAAPTQKLCRLTARSVAARTPRPDKLWIAEVIAAYSPPIPDAGQHAEKNQGKDSRKSHDSAGRRGCAGTERGLMKNNCGAAEPVGKVAEQQDANDRAARLRVATSPIARREMAIPVSWSAPTIEPAIVTFQPSAPSYAERDDDQGMEHGRAASSRAGTVRLDDDA